MTFATDLRVVESVSGLVAVEHPNNIDQIKGEKCFILKQEHQQPPAKPLPPPQSVNTTVEHLTSLQLVLFRTTAVNNFKVLFRQVAS